MSYETICATKPTPTKPNYPHLPKTHPVRGEYFIFSFFVFWQFGSTSAPFGLARRRTVFRLRFRSHNSKPKSSPAQNKKIKQIFSKKKFRELVFYDFGSFSFKFFLIRNIIFSALFCFKTAPRPKEPSCQATVRLQTKPVFLWKPRARRHGKPRKTGCR